MDVDAVVDRAQILADLGRDAEADEVVRDALEEDADNTDLLVLHAILALRSGDVAEAYHTASAAAESDPDDRGALRLLARIYAVLGLTDEAVAVADRVAALHPEDGAGYALLATCLSHRTPLNRNKRAVRHAVDRALALAPDDAAVLLEAARAAERISDGTFAEKLVRAGLRADPGHPELQAMHALDQPFTGDKAAALTDILARDPTDPRVRHALADVVWGTIARLASGVWIYALAVILLSAWVPSRVLTHLVPVLMAPLIWHWTRLFQRLRKRLPRGYLSKRLWHSVSAATGVALAAVAALLASLASLPIIVAVSPDGVRAGYWLLTFTCGVAGLAHLLVTLARIRPSGDVDLHAHVQTYEGTWAVWLVGLGLPIAVGWTFHRFAAQPGALWFALMVLPIVLATFAVESTIKGRRLAGSGRYRLLVTVLLVGFLACCALLLSVCRREVARTSFDGTVETPVRGPERYQITPPSFHFDVPSMSRWPAPDDRGQP